MSLACNPISDFLEETCRLLRQLDPQAIARARDLLLDCYHRGGRVFTLGNGGSASTAQHFACDLAKFVIPPGQRPFDARCLTDNVSLYTAWANDAERADVFVNLMRGFCNPATCPRVFRAWRHRLFGEPGTRREVCQRNRREHDQPGWV